MRALIWAVVLSVAVVGSVAAQAQKKTPSKPRSPLQNPAASILQASVTYDPQSGVIEGMLVAGQDRVIVLTASRFCEAQAGKLITEAGDFTENVFVGGGSKADELFGLLCLAGLRKRAELARATDEELRRRQTSEQQQRDNAFLLREAQCFANPSLCR
jgi:hypothetical protein